MSACGSAWPGQPCRACGSCEGVPGGELLGGFDAVKCSVGHRDTSLLNYNVACHVSRVLWLKSPPPRFIHVHSMVLMLFIQCLN